MKYLTLVLLALFLAGCATTRSMDSADKTQLRGKSLVVVQQESPSFIAMTAGRGAFGGLGVASAISAGNALVNGQLN